MIDLLVVDDHTIFRAGITRLMADEHDIRVTGEASDGTAAIAMVRASHYDVVLMDINMGVRNGFDTLAAIRVERPRLPVIMLSMYVEAQYARRALKASANAYLSKDVSHEELLRAIRQVANGGIYVTTGYACAAFAGENGAAAQPHEVLSPREMQVLQKIAQGVSLTEIAARMCVSVKTTATHRSRILEKLGAASNAELVRYAIAHGLVD